MFTVHSPVFSLPFIGSIKKQKKKKQPSKAKKKNRWGVFPNIVLIDSLRVFEYGRYLYVLEPRS